MPRSHAKVGALWFRPDELALAADVHPRASRPAITRDERPVVAAFAASASLHGVFAVIVALAVGGGGIGRQVPPEAALRATLTTPAQKFAATEPVASPPPLQAPVATVSLQPKARLPAPIPTPKELPVDGSGEGRLIVHVAETDVVPAPGMLAALEGLHPGAVRIVPEFEVAPAGAYPEAALVEKRQFSTEILVVVHEDGRLEVAQGTFEDPIFGDSVRAALASAKAQPPVVDGKAVTGWTVLRFYYEFVGAGVVGAAHDPTR